MSVDDILALQAQHSNTWRDMPEVYWLGRLIQEVSEIAVSLVGEGEHANATVHSVDFELKQVASICINWLEMRQAREGDGDG